MKFNLHIEWVRGTGTIAFVSTNDHVVEKKICGIKFYTGTGTNTKMVAFCYNLPTNQSYHCDFEQCRPEVKGHRSFSAGPGERLFFEMTQNGCYLSLDADEFGLTGPEVDYRIEEQSADGDILKPAIGTVFEKWSCGKLSLNFETTAKSSIDKTNAARDAYLAAVNKLKTVKNEVEFNEGVEAARAAMLQLAHINAYWQGYTNEDYIFEQETIKRALNGDEGFRYQLLARMKQDCLYFLGSGNHAEEHLWAKDVFTHISCMKALWDSFPKDSKPEWLSMEEITQLEQEMARDCVSPAPVKEEGRSMNVTETATCDGTHLNNIQPNNIITGSDASAPLLIALNLVRSRACEKVQWNDIVYLRVDESVKASFSDGGGISGTMAVDRLREVVCDWLKTPEGWKAVQASSMDFNWGDFINEFPALWSSRGITVMAEPDTNCSVVVHTGACVDQDELLAPAFLVEAVIRFADGDEAPILVDMRDKGLLYDLPSELIQEDADTVDVIIDGNVLTASRKDGKWALD